MTKRHGQPIKKWLMHYWFCLFFKLFCFLSWMFYFEMMQCRSQTFLDFPICKNVFLISTPIKMFFSRKDVPLVYRIKVNTCGNGTENDTIDKGIMFIQHWFSSVKPCLTSTSTRFTDTYTLAGRLLQRAHLCT